MSNVLKTVEVFTCGMLAAAVLFGSGFMLGWAHAVREQTDQLDSGVVTEAIHDRTGGRPQWIARTVICEQENGQFTISTCRLHVGGPYITYEQCMRIEARALDVLMTNRPVLARFDCVAEYEA